MPRKTAIPFSYRPRTAPYGVATTGSFVSANGSTASTAIRDQLLIVASGKDQSTTSLSGIPAEVPIRPIRLCGYGCAAGVGATWSEPAAGPVAAQRTPPSRCRRKSGSSYAREVCPSAV